MEQPCFICLAHMPSFLFLYYIYDHYVINYTTAPLRCQQSFSQFVVALNDKVKASKGWVRRQLVWHTYARTYNGIKNDGSGYGYRRYTMSARKLSLHSFHQLTLDDRILIQTGLEQETRLVFDWSRITAICLAQPYCRLVQVTLFGGFVACFQVQPGYYAPFSVAFCLANPLMSALSLAIAFTLPSCFCFVIQPNKHATVKVLFSSSNFRSSKRSSNILPK